MEKFWGESFFSNLSFGMISDPTNRQTQPSQTSEDNNLVFLSQSFVVPERIKFFKFSKTRMNVTNKHLIIIFANNSAYLLDRRAISPRRPIMKGID